MPPLPTATSQPVESWTTPRGVEVHLLRTARFHTVTLAWVAEAPLDEHRSARALLPDLLSRGTARSPGLADMAARCEELYNAELIASVTAHGPRQVLRLGIETIAERHAEGRPLLEQAAGLLREVLHEPPLVAGAFRPDHVDQERTNLVRAIQGLADDKALHAYRRLVETMHAGTPHALHSWGDETLARALTGPDLHRAWVELRDRLPARLLVIGDVGEEQAGRIADDLAGPHRRAPVGPPGRPPPARTGPVQEVTEVQPLAQSKLAMGFRLPAERLGGPAVTLFANVLGGGSHSRLFKRVREAESLAYGCSASALPDSGTLVIQAGIDAQAAPRVRELVEAEIATLARQPVGAEELEVARRAQRRRLLSMVDAPADLLAFRVYGLMTGRAHELDEALAQLDALDADDLVEVAAGTRLDTVFLLEGRLP